MADRMTHDGARWSNAGLDRIEIRPYDVRWSAQFELEAAAIRSALGETFAFSIEHVGSTAVPGLAAKPIIDIVLVVSDRSRWPGLIVPLERIGYEYWAENPDSSRMFFVKGMPPFGTGRTHHVHVLSPDALEPVVRFRDFLVAHHDEARRYAALKHRLAATFEQDRDAYTHAKAEFVAGALQKSSTDRQEE